MSYTLCFPSQEWFSSWGEVNLGPLIGCLDVKKRNKEKRTLTSEREVLAAMQAHVAARINGNVDAVIDSYSEDW
ncbi:MAG: hypothetical protein VB674_04445, partial [Vicinamibacterales bacterium]